MAMTVPVVDLIVIIAPQVRNQCLLSLLCYFINFRNDGIDRNINFLDMFQRAKIRRKEFDFVATDIQD